MAGVFKSVIFVLLGGMAACKARHTGKLSDAENESHYGGDIPVDVAEGLMAFETPKFWGLSEVFESAAKSSNREKAWVQAIQRSPVLVKIAEKGLAIREEFYRVATGDNLVAAPIVANPDEYLQLALVRFMTMTKNAEDEDRLRQLEINEFARHRTIKDHSLMAGTSLETIMQNPLYAKTYAKHQIYFSDETVRRRRPVEDFNHWRQVQIERLSLVSHNILQQMIGAAHRAGLIESFYLNDNRYTLNDVIALRHVPRDEFTVGNEGFFRRDILRSDLGNKMLGFYDLLKMPVEILSAVYRDRYLSKFVERVYG